MGMTARRHLLPRDDRDARPAATATDEDLLATRGAGEADALGELYRRHGPYVFGAAAHLVEPATAATVTQDTFVRCWKDRQSWTGGAETLREQLVSHARAVAASLRLEDPRLAAPRTPDRVINLLGSLTESEAAVLTLLTVGDCTFAEAAGLLAQPDAQVRRQSVSGLRALSVRLRSRRLA